MPVALVYSPDTEIDASLVLRMSMSPYDARTMIAVAFVTTMSADVVRLIAPAAAYRSMPRAPSSGLMTVGSSPPITRVRSSMSNAMVVSMKSPSHLALAGLLTSHVPANAGCAAAITRPSASTWRMARVVGLSVNLRLRLEPRLARNLLVMFLKLPSDLDE